METARLGLVSNRQLVGWLWPWFRRHAVHFFGALVLLVTAQTLVVIGPLLIKRAIDVDIEGSDLAGLYYTVLLYLAVQISQMTISYIMRNWLEWTGQNMMSDLRRHLVRHILRLPMSFHDRHTPGQLLSRVESDTQALRMLFTTTGVMMLGDLLLLTGMFIVMFNVSMRMTLVAATVLPVMAAITWYFQRRIHPIFVQVRAQNSEMASRLTELCQALPVVVGSARRPWAVANMQTLGQAKYLKSFEGQRLIVLWLNLAMLLQTLALASILGLGGYWALQGIVTIGTLAMFMSYVRRFFDPLARLAEQLSVVQKAFASAERIYTLLREPEAIADPPSPTPWPGMRKELRFENVWFRYHEDSPWALQDVSFTLPAGQSWALVGPSGSGKSTIVSLLLRYYEPTRGRVTIDGVDLRQLAQPDLRRHIALVMQDIYLFPGDLLGNLAMGMEGDAQEGSAAGVDHLQPQVEAIAKITRADRFIQQLPGGYRAEIAERGANLSMGQRQLLSLTRALVRDPPLVILDEATSAVDPASEAAITAATQHLLGGRTGLVIAHRLSTIRHCDWIMVLRAGQIAEQGTHKELIAAGGVYSGLHALQKLEDSHAS